VKYDHNRLELKAKEFMDAGRYYDALKIYLYMSDGDQSLDGGYLAEQIGKCYEALKDPYSAKYWYGRAVEENPEVRDFSLRSRERLSALGIDDLLD
jgi:tetratricopeptide (TPR) repeat protein